MCLINYSGFILIIAFLTTSDGRIHKLTIEGDARKCISLTRFGFFKGGILDVKLHNFHADVFGDNDLFGFSLDRTLNDAMSPYIEARQDKCLLDPDTQISSNSFPVFFIMNKQGNQKTLDVKSSKHASLLIYRSVNEIPDIRAKRTLNPYYESDLRNKLNGHFSRNIKSITDPKKELIRQFPLTESKPGYYNTSFVIYIASDKDEGLYNLYFHNCPSYRDSKVNVDFTIEIEEKNIGSYLSAGEMPLPALYFMMSILFFLSGCFWVFILAKSKHTVFKIHYLMAVLVYLKSLSLLFHAINYHFIQTRGEHVAAWAILFYITHLLKGSVLFITIVLIGTGWTFIKHLLSEKDKKIFMIVIPLQVLANVAKIIIEESEEGYIEHKAWLDIFMYVDLLCCGAILFPVVWSIRHLQEASRTDGKAAINLRKLKIFRHFYIMIVCYIYFTRIIVYLLQMTVSFQYKWLDEMFREMVTYVFFVLTGYKFRPASANPYFQVGTDDSDLQDMDIVVSECGIKEGLSKLSRINMEGKDEDKECLLPSKRESSHEYD